MIKLSLVRFAAAALAAVALASPAMAQEDFGDILRADFAELSVPGAGYAVVADGKIIESGGIGVADIGSGSRVDAQTPFRIASLTKPIAAALLLDAEQSGALSLDTPLVSVSERFRTRCQPIKDFFESEGLSYLDGIECGSEAITLRSIATHSSTAPVGSRFVYNGFLYGLLADPIGDAIMGEGDASFARAMRARVIEPLGLAHSAAGIGDPQAEAVVSALATPHRGGADGWEARPPLTDDINAGAGFIASAEDLATIDIAYRERLLADPALWDRMTTPAVLTDGARSPYGIGWFVQDIDGRSIAWHYGHQPDAYSGLWIKDTSDDMTLILLANSDGLAAGNELGLGDLSRSAIAMTFLRWAAQRRCPAGQ